MPRRCLYAHGHRGECCWDATVREPVEFDLTSTPAMEFTPEELQLRSKLLERSFCPWQVEECTPEEVEAYWAARAVEKARDEKREARMAKTDARRLARAIRVQQTYSWAPFRFGRWVRSVIRGIRMTKWRFLIRLAGGRPS